MATSKDVARLAGVSHTTVSRAFRNDPKVKPATRQRIMKIAEELGYTPNQVASNLRSQKTRTVGLIISFGFNPFFLEITHSLETELASHGYRLLIAFDEADPDRQWNILQSLSSAQVNSILFTPLYRNADQKNRLHSWMKHSPIHFLQLIAEDFNDFPSFTFDDNLGAYLGTRHLLSQGHRNILMVGGTNRVEGYTRAFEEIGCRPAFPYQNLSSESREQNFEKIKAAILSQKPTAVFAIAYDMNYLAYEVLLKLNLRVPEDISFLAFDDDRWLQLLGISVIGHPIQALSGSIVREILSYEAGDEVYPSSTSFKPFLIERDSVLSI